MSMWCCRRLLPPLPPLLVLRRMQPGAGMCCRFRRAAPVRWTKRRAAWPPICSRPAAACRWTMWPTPCSRAAAPSAIAAPWWPMAWAWRWRACSLLPGRQSRPPRCRRRRPRRCPAWSFCSLAAACSTPTWAWTCTAASTYSGRRWTAAAICCRPKQAGTCAGGCSPPRVTRWRPMRRCPPWTRPSRPCSWSATRWPGCGWRAACSPCPCWATAWASMWRPAWPACSSCRMPCASSRRAAACCSRCRRAP